MKHHHPPSPPVSFAARATAFTVRIYQRFLSPVKIALMGPQAACRYSPTCSQYAVDALHRHGFWMGCWYAARRISRCHPFHEGGIDPVPERLPQEPKECEIGTSGQVING
jgi:putative membrane protein insertion efficiency factor